MMFLLLRFLELPNTIIMVSYNRYFYESNIFNYSMQDVPSECAVSTSLGVNSTDMLGKKYYRHAAHRLTIAGSVTTTNIIVEQLLSATI
uniref:Uncharacterized protein n=1 Tax=Glossina palpalis gambiensis TaxID=67801 RepID=A0A1B0B3Z5_9MUSC